MPDENAENRGLNITKDNPLGDGAEEGGHFRSDPTAGRRAGERFAGNKQIVYTSLQISAFQGLMVIVRAEQLTFRPD